MTITINEIDNFLVAVDGDTERYWAVETPKVNRFYRALFLGVLEEQAGAS